MSEIMEYKCPCCGGAVSFDSKAQTMKCPYCDTEFDPEALSEQNDELNNDQNEEMQWDSTPEAELGDEDGLAAYCCKSCGGEIIADETTAATSCPFCGNPVIIPAKLSGTLKPDYVIPFKIDKKAAKEALLNHYKGKRLLPKVFRDENHLDEIRGIYVPFWLFDADANADIRYKATRVRMWSDKNYDYTETSYFSVQRGGSLGFERVPVDGSTKMADELMESIEPFDFSEAVDFGTAYLSGYLADKYDVDATESIGRANERIKKSTEAAFADTVHGYTSVLPVSSNIRLQNSSAKYALFPIWLLNTTWQGKKYVFVMNGQTGKFAGDLPMDKSAFARWFAGITAGVGAAAFAISYLMWML
ncbi:MAG: hypothetical protein IJV87_07565 [Clostridia bacterium]|nr:hypothetical protein [Clostridia bacterium]